jgi:hypothetical protein
MGLAFVGLTVVACTATVESGGTGGSGSNGATAGDTTTGSSTAGSSSGSSGTTCTGRVPAVHRPSEPPCAPTTGMSCTTDADCVQPGGVGATVTGKCSAGTCDFNKCTQDSDCTGMHEICSCQDDVGDIGSSQGSVCVEANCHTDADCGSNGYCSPTVDSQCGSFYGTVGWYCHTCEDTCTEDADCQLDGGNNYCAFDPTVGHWACESGFCAG